MKKAILLFLLLAGCAYPKKDAYFSSPRGATEKVVVYLYRSPTSIDSLNPDVPVFYINDEKIGRLVIGGHYRLEVAPGPYEISFRTPLFGIPMFKSAMKFRGSGRAGEIYFVKFAIETWSQGLGLMPVPAALEELSKTRLLLRK